MKRGLLLLFMMVAVTLGWSEEEPYLGGNYNGRFAYIDNCAYLFAEKEYAIDAAFIAGYGHCDHYVDSSQNIFERSYTVSAGVSQYSVNVYRDGFYIGSLFGVEYGEVNAIINNDGGQRISLVPMFVLGYQWQFRRGFQLAFGGGLKLRYPVWYTADIADTSSAIGTKVHSELIVPSFTFRPTLFIGWRF